MSEPAAGQVAGLLATRGSSRATSPAIGFADSRWADLARRHGTPFAHPLWHQTWLRHFGDDGIEPHLVDVVDGDRLTGLVPLQRDQHGWRQLGNPKIADYTGVALEPGYEADVATALLDWLEVQHTGSLELWGLPADGDFYRALHVGASDRGWGVEAEPEAVCPRVSLQGGWDAYLASLAKHDRHELRRKLRNFEARGKVEWQVATGAGEVDARMDALIEMMRASHDGKVRFLSPQMEAFFRDVARTFADLAQARLCTVTLDGAPAAMLLAFETGREVLLYNSGYDPALASLSPGLVSKALALRDAIDRGKETFDFLRGNEDYKFRLGGEPRQLVRLRLARPGGSGGG